MQKVLNIHQNRIFTSLLAKAISYFKWRGEGKVEDRLV